MDVESITPEVAALALKADSKGKIGRAREGRLTGKERTLLKSIRDGKPNEPATTTSKTKLGEILGVRRETIHVWGKLDGAPVASSNGTHDVKAWRDFMRAKELKGGVADTDEETLLKARKLLAEVEEKEIKVQIKRGEWIKLDDVRTQWTHLIATATTLLRQKFEQELPPILSGLDAVGIQDEARRAIDEVLAILHDAP